MRVISSRNEITKVNPDEKFIHFAFRPSNKDIFLLAETCPKLEIIQLPASYIKSVSKAIEMFLEMQKINLFEGDVWGHRKDLSDYYNTPSSMLIKIKDMKDDGLPEEKIANKIAKEYKFNPKMVSYIMQTRQYDQISY